MAETAVMETRFGEKISAWWAGGQVRVQINDVAPIAVLPHDRAPWKLQLFESDSGAWWLFILEPGRAPVALVCHDRVTWQQAQSATGQEVQP